MWSNKTVSFSPAFTINPVFYHLYLELLTFFLYVKVIHALIPMELLI